MVSAHRQQGAVLIMSMVFLLIMTMLGVSAFNSTTMEEKMSSNMRDRMVALQAAEVALQEGQDYMDSISAVTEFDDGDNGLYITNDEVWETLNWDGFVADYIYNGTATHPVVYVTGVLSEVAAPPMYVVEMGNEIDSEEESLNLSGGYGDDVGGGSTTVFKLTALGTGSSANSRAIIQVTYGKQL